MDSLAIDAQIAVLSLRRGLPKVYLHVCYLVLLCAVLYMPVQAAQPGSAVPKVDLDDFPNASFHEGLAAVRLGKKYGYINRRGEIIIEPRFQFAQIFSEGLARVVINDRSGYIDKTGRVVIAPQFYRAYKFSDGLARVCAPPRDPSVLFRLLRLIGWEDRDAYPCGYIDRTGKQVIDYLYLPSHGFEHGYARVTTLDGREGYIDHAGKFYVTRPAD